jgi:hypothetical protein
MFWVSFWSVTVSCTQGANQCWLLVDREDGGWVEGKQLSNSNERGQEPEITTLENKTMFIHRITQSLIHTSHL